MLNGHGTLAVFCNHTKLKHRSGYSQEVFSESWLNSFHFKMNWFLKTDVLQLYRTTILHQWYSAMPRQHSEDSEVSSKSCWSLSFRMPIVPWTTMKCATFKTLLGLLCPFFLGKRCFTVGSWIKWYGTFVYFGFSGVHVFDKLPQTVQWFPTTSPHYWGPVRENPPSTDNLRGFVCANVAQESVGHGKAPPKKLYLQRDECRLALAKVAGGKYLGTKMDQMSLSLGA